MKFSVINMFECLPPLLALMVMEDDPSVTYRFHAGNQHQTADLRPQVFTPRGTDREGTCESVRSLASREAPRRMRRPRGYNEMGGLCRL
jgi:hypothetical protein